MRIHTMLHAGAIAAVAASATCVVAQDAGEGREIACEVDGSTMRLIPDGAFTMGSGERADDSPAHEVHVDAFYLDVNEVTHAQWKQFIAATPEWHKEQIDPALHDGNYLKHWDRDTYERQLDNHPVFNISWHAAEAYAKWAGKRLPTEAEWERAARGPEGFDFAYGNAYDETKANTGYARGETAPVGSFPPNSYGIADLSGNVMEWCADWFSDTYYASSPGSNPTGPETGAAHVLRGGSWGYIGERTGTTYRFHMTPPIGDRSCSDRVGFRCAMDVPEAE